MRAAGAADDGAHLRRHLEERPAPPRRPPPMRPRHDANSGGSHAVQPVRGATVAPRCRRTSGRNDQQSASLGAARPEERSSGNPGTRSSERRRPHDARGDRTMSMTSTDAATGSRDIKSHEKTSFADLGKEMWAYLTGKGAAINYEFVDMVVEVPRETGPDAPRAVWRLNGTLRITTAENASQG